MKVNEIAINGKIYRACYVSKDNTNLCNNCDLKSKCDTDTNEIIRDICSYNFACNFKEVKQKENTTNKFYRFSSGTMFNLNLLSEILFITFVEKYNPEYYSFTIILTKGNVELGFKNAITANRERNKFIKFIENYEYTNNSN